MEVGVKSAEWGWGVGMVKEKLCTNPWDRAKKVSRA